jgi:hypothetical protein
LIVILWAILYPLSALATVGTWFAIHALVEPYCGNLEGLNRALILYAVPSLSALLVLWPTSRWDHRLSSIRLYWLIRHLVRLVLFALVVLYLHFRFQEGHLMALPPSADDFQVFVSDPIRIGVGCFAVLIVHLCLCHWEWLRDCWHETLAGMALRPKSL